MKQYLDILNRIIHEGQWVENKRTNTRCLTIINADLEYDVGNGVFPLLTTRKMYFRQAIGEMLGYLRGYTNISQFHKLGVKTWDANANNPVWLESEHRQGEGDLGLIYGAVGNTIPVHNEDRYLPWLDTIISKIQDGNDDRGLIWSFWNPGMFHLGCLRPCMYEHQFSLIGDTLYLNSTQRSCDFLLGGAFNMVQCYFLLWVMAKLTGKKPGKVYHKMVNVHIYANQLRLVEEQLRRQPYNTPTLHCNKSITYESVFGLCEKEEDNLHPNDFDVINYQYHPAIKYPFTV